MQDRRVELDGIRTFAVVAVVAEHSFLERAAGGGYPRIVLHHNERATVSWTDILAATSGTAGVTGGGILLALKRAKRSLVDTIEHIAKDAAAAANEPLESKVNSVAHDLNNMKLSMATQFGGNGGGMRQAINELKVDVAKMEGIVTSGQVIHAMPYESPHPSPGPKTEGA